MDAESVALVLKAFAAVLWPIAVVVVVIVLRGHLGGMFARVVSAKFPGGELVLETRAAAEELKAIRRSPAIPAELRGPLAAIETRLDRVAVAGTGAFTIPTLPGDRYLILDLQTGRSRWESQPAPATPE